MSGIKFGTDGWRAVVGKDFNAENVEIVSNAIGKYVFENYGIYKTIIVGYDPRNMAREFSMQCAEILKNRGFKVLYSDKVIPTPVLAYNAKVLDACAVMFTASHNPPEYLGIKFIPDYAGPATSEITDEIVSNFGKESSVCVKGDIIVTDFSASYFKRIKEIIDFSRIKDLKKRIIFDGLYAASIGYFDKLLSDNGIEYDSIHMYHDPNFGGGMPEPKPKYMSEMIDYVKKHDFCAIISSIRLPPTVLTNEPEYFLFFFKCIKSIAIISFGVTYSPFSLTTPNLSESPSLAKPV